MAIKDHKNKTTYRDVEEILMRGLDTDASSNTGLPVCEWRDRNMRVQSCFGVGAGVRGVSLPELLWVFRDFDRSLRFSLGPMPGEAIQF